MNPKRVSGDLRTVRWTVRRREGRSGYAARSEYAQRTHPSFRARKDLVIIDYKVFSFSSFILLRRQFSASESPPK